MPRSWACCSRSPASCGFVANMISSGTPASSRRSSSAAQSAGRYRARPIRACPAGDAQVRVTATWHIAMPPTVPLYWRAAPAQSAEDFSSAVSSTISTTSSSSWPAVRCAAAQSAAASSSCRSSTRARDSRCCIRYGLACPAASASVQQLWSSSSRQQPVHHVTAGQPGLPAGEARRYPGHQVIEQARMRVMIYAGSSGCRVVVVFHKPA